MKVFYPAGFDWLLNPILSPVLILFCIPVDELEPYPSISSAKGSSFSLFKFPAFANPVLKFPVNELPPVVCLFNGFEDL